MAENANSALAVWNALKPKIRQLIQEEARSAVRRKKMTILSINTANQSVTVYEAANPNVTLTLQYRKESGVGSMSAGQGVMVEWTYDDLSTAVVSGPGQGWSANTVDGSDTGWQDLNPVFYRKFGNIVYISCHATFSSALAGRTWTTINTLPASVRPSRRIDAACALGANAEIVGSVRIQADGSVDVYPSAAVSSPYIAFSASYPV